MTRWMTATAVAVSIAVAVAWWLWPVPSRPAGPTPVRTTAPPGPPRDIAPPPDLVGTTTEKWNAVRPVVKLRSWVADSHTYVIYETSHVEQEAGFHQAAVTTLDFERRVVREVDAKVLAPCSGADEGTSRILLLQSARKGLEDSSGLDQDAARVRSVCLLAKFGKDEKLFPELEALAFAESPDSVAVAAAVLMAQWGDVDRVRRWIRTAPAPRAELFMSVLPVPTTAKTRGRVVIPAGTFHPDVGLEALSRFGESNDAITRFRLNALLVLVAHDERVARYFLAEGKNASRSHATRAQAIRALGSALSHPAIASEVLALLKSEDPLLVRHAVACFEYGLLSSEQVNGVIDVLRSPDPSLVKQAVKVLATAPPVHASLILPALQDLATTHSDESVRREAKDASKRVGR